MFRALGILLACYTAYSAVRGEVFAKRGPWGRSYRREDGPTRFWSIIGVYTLLSVALVFYF